MYAPTEDAPQAACTAYSDTAGAPTAAAPLGDSVVADIAVIGGGFLGTSAALEAAQRGARVCLVERRTIGWGAAGRNAGHVAAHATKLDPDAVLRVYGPHFGPRLNEAGAQAPTFVLDLAGRHGMDISPVRGGILNAALTDVASERFRRRAEYWAGQGASVEFLDRAATAAVIGSDFYRSSVIDRRSIAINPLAFVRGLARAAIKAGAILHEETHVTRITSEAGRWRVHTPHGAITADHVLICANAYVGDLWPGLQRTIMPVRGYQIWTAPLDAADRTRLLRGISSMLDSRRMPSGMRMHADGKLQFSGGAGFGRERAPDIAACVAGVRRLFPGLRMEIAGWWSGWIAKGVADGWRIHRLAPGVATAIGCNGRGVAMGAIMGRELARLALGARLEDLLVPLSAPKSIRGHAVYQPVGAAIASYHRWRDRRDIHEARRSA